MLKNVGSGLYTDDFIAKVLTWVQLKGYNTEASSQNKVFHEVIMTCADHAGFIAGQTPDMKIMVMMAEYNTKYHSGDTSWMKDIETRYKL